MKPTQGQGRLLWLEASRGIAALLVIFFHTTVIMSLPKYYGENPLDGFFSFGNAGVEFFFVLSGFIILYIHYKDIGDRKKLRSYFTKRLIRIYPIHWIVTFIFIVGLLVYPLKELPSLDETVRSFLLIPDASPPLGVVAWTLIYALVCGDLAGVLKKPWRFLVFLGSASYSIYLLHFLALSVFIKVLLKLGVNDWLSLTMNYFILVALAVMAGSLLHIYIEMPVLRWCRKKMLSAR